MMLVLSGSQEGTTVPGDGFINSREWNARVGKSVRSGRYERKNPCVKSFMRRLRLIVKIKGRTASDVVKIQNEKREHRRFLVRSPQTVKPVLQRQVF